VGDARKLAPPTAINFQAFGLVQRSRRNLRTYYYARVFDSSG
jgi:hypothetical protein